MFLRVFLPFLPLLSSCVHVHACRCVYTHMYTCMCVHVLLCVCVLVHMCVGAYVSVCARVCTMPCITGPTLDQCTSTPSTAPQPPSDPPST